MCELVGCNHHLFLHIKNKRDGIHYYNSSTLPPHLFSTLDLNSKRNLNLSKAHQAQAGCAYRILNKKKTQHIKMLQFVTKLTTSKLHWHCVPVNCVEKQHDNLKP